MGMVLKRSKIIRIGRGGLDHVEKRLMRGSSPKRISQSVKRVNVSTADPHTTRTESSIAHALLGGFCYLYHLAFTLGPRMRSRRSILSFTQ